MKENNTAEFDVVIVGASISGCAAATTFARDGFKVALVEARRELDSYKKICTHYLLPCSRPALQRLGVAGEIEASFCV